MAGRTTLRGTYLDSSALVKMVVHEPESSALRRFLRTRRPYFASALVRTETARAVLPFGEDALRECEKTLARIDLIRVTNPILRSAGTLLPHQIRSLDAIHLATARALGDAVALVVTYDERMAEAARGLGFRTAAPR